MQELIPGTQGLSCTCMFGWAYSYGHHNIIKFFLPTWSVVCRHVAHIQSLWYYTLELIDLTIAPISSLYVHEIVKFKPC